MSSRSPLSSRSPFVTTLIAIAWLLGVILGVRLIEGGLQLWQRQKEDLAQSQEKLRRMHGWLSVESEVASRRNEILGPFAQVEKDELPWASLQKLQQLAQEQGLTITDLRPSQLSGGAGQDPIHRLDLKLEGALSQMNAFLKKLPESIPVAQLENLQMVPQEEPKVQMLLRLRLLSEVAPR